ncbi:MAG: amino acid adenylation domain-containing protein [Bacteroidales bacterium]
MKINLIEYFEETFPRVQEKIAVVEGERTITFAELANRAKQLANTILSTQDFINQPIALYLPKSIESVYADLAITYSGNIYMNLDIKTPLTRIQNIVELIRPKVLITNSKLIDQLGTVIDHRITIINIDDLHFENEVDHTSFLLNRLSSALIDTDPYCIINTSGSTGTPKGVVLNHRSFFDFMARSQEIFNFSDHEIMGSLSPIVFDIYSFELCMMMAKSTTLVLIPDLLSAFPVSILKILQEQKVSFIFWVPTIMVNIANLDLLTKIELPDLKLVWFAGEVFPTKQFNCWRNGLPHITFANLYGPIEITLDCTFYVVKRELRDDEPIPIGCAYKNTGILILNEENQPVEKGEEGELCVRGTSLAMGYYNNPEKTAAAFVQNPLNDSYPEIIYRTGDVVFVNPLGEIVFKGRKDTLIKHMGYRIELGEIEHVIVNTLKIAKNGCVVYHYAKKEITLFYENENEIDTASFRKILAQTLPKYMIPAIFIRLDELQRNTNGKIDRLFYTNQING